jgi:hypothetical protein
METGSSMTPCSQHIIRHVHQMAVDTEFVQRLDPLKQFLNLPRRMFCRYQMSVESVNV